MSQKINGDPAAASMARKRWEKASESQRQAHARKMAKARWVKRRKEKTKKES
jgi:hypothetical protein